MSYEPKVYTFGHVLGMTGMMAAATTFMYVTRHKHDDLTWFMENWGLYIGITCTALVFLFGLSIIGTPWYDQQTNEQHEADQNRAEFEWSHKSPEERAIITAAREIELLQLTQIMQNDRLIRNKQQQKKSS